MIAKTETKYNNIQNNQQTKFNLFLIPLMLVIIIVPLVTRLYSGYTDIFQFTFGERNYNYLDLDLHYKAVVFSILAFLTLIPAVIHFIRMPGSDRIAALKRLIPILIYAFFILVSFSQSINKKVSLTGDYGQEEPVLVLLGYVIVLIYAFLTVKSENDVKWLSYAAMANSIIVSLIGFIQFAGVDIVQTALYKFLVLPSNYPDVTITGSGYVNSTLMNSNFVGTYVCIMLPLVASLLFAKSSIPEKIVSGIVSVMLLGFLLVSFSKTGMIILVIELIALCIFQINEMAKKWWVAFLLVVFLIIGFFLYNKVTENSLINAGKYVLANLSKREYNLKGIDTTNNYIKILYKDYELKITFDIENEADITNFTCFSGTEPIPCTELTADGCMSLLLPDGSELPLQLMNFENKYLVLTIFNENGYGIYLTKDEYNDYVVINAYGNKVDSKLDTNLLNGYETLATSRGGIWRSAITVLPKYIIYGAGPDCYPYAIYKNGMDIVSAYRLTNAILVSPRPHNYYLQTAINTGVLSLIACLAAFIWYIIDCFKLYFIKQKKGIKIYGFACFLAVTGFLLCGIANDSLICVSPLFWIVLGTGMAINKLLFCKKDA